MVKTARGGHVRSFSVDKDNLNDIATRSNKRHDQLIVSVQLDQQLKDVSPNKAQKRNASVDRQSSRGIMGVCLFRELTYFDIGRSFMADSLHNIHIGAFVSFFFAYYCTRNERS